MYCKYCGQQIDDDSVFCKHCGKSLETTLEKADEGVIVEKDLHEPSTIKVELIKSEGLSEEKVKKGIIGFLNELFILAILISIAFIFKEIIFTDINTRPFPEVTEEEQKAFNDAIYLKRHPKGVPPMDELLKGTWDENKYPIIDDVAFGLEAAKYLHWGDYEYDKEAYSLSQLEHLNQFRKDARYFHALDISNYVFWILLIGLPLIRYVIYFIKWLSKSKT